MEIACVIDCRLATPERPGRSGGLRPGRNALADPVAAAELTEAMARALEGIGAAVETERAGEAFFAVGGLRGLYGDEIAGVMAVARRAVGVPVRLGVAPTRTAACAAAGRGELVIGAGELDRFLAPLPTAVLVEEIELPEGMAGSQLDRALAVAELRAVTPSGHSFGRRG